MEVGAIYRSNNKGIKMTSSDDNNKNNSDTFINSDGRSHVPLYNRIAFHFFALSAFAV